MWTWRVSRACFAGAAVLAALVFSSASLGIAQVVNDAERDLPGALEVLTWVFVVTSLTALTFSLLFVLLTLCWWGYRWWTPLEVRDTERTSWSG